MNIRKYRRRPIIVEAVKLEYPNDPDEIAAWCKGVRSHEGELGKEVSILIHSMEGSKIAHHGDWIVRDIKGQFFPVSQTVFDKVYEEYR